MHLSTTFIALGALATGIGALPTTVPTTAVGSRGLELSGRSDINQTSDLWDDEGPLTVVDWNIVHSDIARRADPTQFEKRCDFDDGHGRMSCDHFSITFGKEGVYTAPAGKNFIKITGHGWQIEGWLRCPDFAGTEWHSVPSELPWTVDIYPGYACNSNVLVLFDAWRATTVNYANQHLMIASDTRCGPILSGGLGRRCIIPVRP